MNRPNWTVTRAGRVEERIPDLEIGVLGQQVLNDLAATVALGFARHLGHAGLVALLEPLTRPA